jgi:hypothetical protein
VQADFVELRHRGTVGTLHVVGVDLQLRLGVDLRLGAGQQVLVGQLGTGFLGLRMDVNAPVEHRRRAIGDDAAKHLVTAAVGHGVLDAGVVVDVLLAAGQVDAVQGSVGARAA